MLTKYKPSGEVGNLFAILGPLSIAAGIGLGIGHRIAMAAPIRNTALPLLIFLAGVGLVTAGTVYFGRCRSRVAGLLFAGLVTLATLSAAHVTSYRRSPDGLAAGASPAAWVESQVKKGVDWRRSANTIRHHFHGWQVWSLWIVEALVVAAAAGAGALMPATKPFCESCKSYADRDPTVAEHPHPTDEWIKAAERCESLDVLQRPLTQPEPIGEHALVFLRTACKCGGLRILTIVWERASKSRDDKGEGSGKPHRKSKVIRNNLVLDDVEAVHLDAIFKTLAPGKAAAPASRA